MDEAVIMLKVRWMVENITIDLLKNIMLTAVIGHYFPGVVDQSGFYRNDFTLAIF
jgi:hypothetical protein